MPEDIEALNDPAVGPALTKPGHHSSKSEPGIGLAQTEAHESFNT